LGNLLFGHLY